MVSFNIVNNLVSNVLVANAKLETRKTFWPIFYTKSWLNYTQTSYITFPVLPNVTNFEAHQLSEFRYEKIKTYFIFLLCNDSFRNTFLSIILHKSFLLSNSPVHKRLGEIRIVTFIMTVLTITNLIENDQNWIPYQNGIQM